MTAPTRWPGEFKTTRREASLRKRKFRRTVRRNSAMWTPIISKIMSSTARPGRSWRRFRISHTSRVSKGGRITRNSCWIFADQCLDNAAMAARPKPVSVVTGGAGFLGSHLVDRLLAEGHRVIAIDNLITGNTANIGHLAGNENFRFIKHNVYNFIFLL